MQHVISSQQCKKHAAMFCKTKTKPKVSEKKGATCQSFFRKEITTYRIGTLQSPSLNIRNVTSRINKRFCPADTQKRLRQLISSCLFVSRVGWIPGLAPVPPLPDGRVRICRDPQSSEFPLHHYSGLGIISSYSV